MERKKNRIKDNVGSYNESCDKESASTKVYAAHFVLQKCPKTLKENFEKKENGGISQAGQRENHRFFRSLSR